MMPIKQSVCIPILRPANLPLEEFLENVSQIGFAAVEIWLRDPDFETLVSLTRKYHLTIASMIGHAMDRGGLNDPANHDRIEADLRASIDVAARYGIPGLICFSGNRRPGLDDPQGITHTAAGLRRVAPYAEKKGVNLNLELLNSKVDHPGYQCDHTPWGRAVVEQVNSPRVKLLYDIYHMQIMEGDIIRTIRDNIGWIGHFHTAGVPGRHEIGPNQELNYAAIAQAISTTSYNLFMGHEFSSAGDLFEGLRQAYSICNQ
jgi:hydroxypyruvate isomerase